MHIQSGVAEGDTAGKFYFHAWSSATMKCVLAFISVIFFAYTSLFSIL